MSVLPLKADMRQRGLHVRLVPTADINRCCCGGVKVSRKALQSRVRLHSSVWIEMNFQRPRQAPSSPIGAARAISRIHLRQPRRFLSSDGGG